MVTKISFQKIAVFFMILLVSLPFADICAQSYRSNNRSLRWAAEYTKDLREKEKKERKIEKEKGKKEKIRKNRKKEGDVTLTVMGDGGNKEQAIQVALRSAIEQAFGVFVSSHSEILNDDLVKDEIATVASGNIKEFKCLSENYVDGKCFVTVQAVVSTNNLISYTKSKGASAELAGATFAMNLRMLELNKRNETLAMQHLVRQLAEIAPIMFDYEIKVGEFNARLSCPLEICINVNENAAIMYKMLTETLEALSLTEVEVSDLKKIDIETYKMSFSPYYERWIYTNRRPAHETIYYFRSSYDELFYDLCKWIVACSMNFKLIDDFGTYATRYGRKIRNVYSAEYGTQDFGFNVNNEDIAFNLDCDHIRIVKPRYVENYSRKALFYNSCFLYFAHKDQFNIEVSFPFIYYKEKSPNNSVCRLLASMHLSNIEMLNKVTKIQIERGDEILKISNFISF